MEITSNSVLTQILSTRPFWIKVKTGAVYLYVKHHYSTPEEIDACIAQIISALKKRVYEEIDIELLANIVNQNKGEFVFLTHTKDQQVVPIDFTLSRDFMKAYVKIPNPNRGMSTPTYQDVIDFLSTKNIFKIIDPQRLEALIELEMASQAILVAEGTPAKQGMDGYFKPEKNFDIRQRKNYDTSQEEKVYSDVDIRKWRDIPFIKKGEKVGSYIPETTGTPGVDVLGNPILPKPGKPREYILVGMERRGNDFYAIEQGYVLWEDDTLTLTKDYHVFGDVSHQTGHIRYAGNVFVHGNVLAGFQLYVGGDLIIDGIATFSKLTVGGNLFAKGLKHVKAIVRGNLFAHFVEYSEGKVASDVLIQDGLLDSNFYVDRNLVVFGKKGKIVGGQNIVTQNIFAFQIGSVNYVQTRLKLGVPMSISNRIEKVLLEKKTLEEKLHQLVKGKRELLKEMSETTYRARIQSLRMSINKLDGQKQQLNVEAEQLGFGCIYVSKNIYPRVEIKIRESLYFHQKETEIGLRISTIGRSVQTFPFEEWEELSSYKNQIQEYENIIQSSVNLAKQRREMRMAPHNK